MDFIKKLVFAMLAIAMLGVSLFLSIFVFGFIAAIGLVVAGRIWWLKRKHLSTGKGSIHGTTIEGEYSKVEH
jgi:hypothetical protein